jgi:hypothetical protein
MHRGTGDMRKQQQFANLLFCGFGSAFWQAPPARDNVSNHDDLFCI